MGSAILNRVLKELNLEEYKSRFIAQSMDDNTIGAIVDNPRFCIIIQKIVRRREHAIQIQNKFKELRSSRNEGERRASASNGHSEGQVNTSPRSASGSRSSAAGSSPGSGSTDSLLTHSIAAAGSASTPVVPLATSADEQSPPSPTPGPSTSKKAPRNGEAEAVGNGENSKFDSHQTPHTRVLRKRTKSTKTQTSHLNRPTGTTKESWKNDPRPNPNKISRFRGS